MSRVEDTLPENPPTGQADFAFAQWTATWRMGRIEPRKARTFASFHDWCHKPLGHPSGRKINDLMGGCNT